VQIDETQKIAKKLLTSKQGYAITGKGKQLAKHTEKKNKKKS
jgi:hypothetical protein